MAIQYRSPGLVLKKIDLGEADQLFSVFTKDFGKIEILGRGIRKISSKLRAGIDIFYLSDIEFVQGRTQKRLTGATQIEKFKNLRKDLPRLNVAYAISESTDQLIKIQEPDEKIFNLLLEVFKKLNDPQFKIRSLQLIYFYFLWNCLSILGYRPDLYFCQICQKKLKPERLYFDRKEKGIVCQNCIKKTKGILISSQIIKILRIILEQNLQILGKLKAGKQYLRELADLSKNYLYLIF